MKQVKRGGGWHAVGYTLRKARQAGGIVKLWKAMRTKNVCKTCALGMGGQAGGMVNETGSFPEVCKKSLQAMVADMQGAVGGTFSIPTRSSNCAPFRHENWNIAAGSLRHWCSLLARTTTGRSHGTTRSTAWPVS